MEPAPEKPQRIVVAMSGGVDSSVTAALMKRAGHHVIGVTLRLYSGAPKKKGACCAGQDIYDAQRVARELGIAHYVLDYEARFRERVIADFAETYARGETPIPCVRCNERVKFSDLLDTARDLGAAALATGHYVRRVETDKGAQLHAARDLSRDQSYFLFATTRAQLEFLRFPLGDMQKSRVRAIAAELGLTVADKPDSQDICFVPDGDYARVVERMRPGAAHEGDIVDEEGRVLGRHMGVVHFTVGQRKGLGLSGTEPRFVLSLDAVEKRVVVGPRRALARRSFVLRDVNWLIEAREAIDCTVKVRSMRAPVLARIVPVEQSARVELAEPEDGVAPGQACVFYAGSRVLGGGWIARSEAKAAAA